MQPTILHRLAYWAETEPQAVAQKYRQNAEWLPITAREFADRVFYLGLFLEQKGVGSQDIVAIFAYNSYQWVHMDLAPQMIGAKSAGIYPNSTQKDISYILEHTEAKVLCVQNKDYYERIIAGGKKLPESIQIVIVFEGDANFVEGGVTYRQALDIGRSLGATRSMREYLKKIDPNDGAFLIYTSGTTGSPKGAVLSHDNLAFATDAIVERWGLMIGPGETCFSFLPLSHIAEKLQTIGVAITARFTVHFCTKFDNVATEIVEVQPSILLCVPRLWEKMMEGVQHKLKNAPPVKKKLAAWALGVGSRYNEAKLLGKMPPILDALQYPLAYKIIISKVRHALGAAKVKKAASGAAPLAGYISHWFRALGMEILEDYGQTETTGIVCMTIPGVDCAGVVGKPALRTEFKLAEDGEILTRGRHVFLGYFKNDQATKDTVDSEGWLHTGDLGEWTTAEMIKIRGRKKEIMKSSGGKMVAPLPIEEEIKSADIISQVCMVGDNRKYFSALVTLSENARARVNPSKIQKLDGAEVVKDESIVGEVKKVFDSVNSKLATYEQIKYFTVLGKEFSIEAGEMTPTMKMKRNVVEERYKDVVNAMYSSER